MQLSQVKDTTLRADTLPAGYGSLFSDHALKPIHASGVLKNDNSLLWPAVLMFVVLALIVFARVSEPRKLVKVFTSFYSLQASRQLQREDYKLGKRLSVTLLLVFLISMSFFIYLFNDYFGFILQDRTGLQQFIFFAVLVSLVYTFKYLFSMMIAYIIDATDLVKEYMFNVSIFSQVLGVALFPFIVAMQYSKYQVEWFLYPALVIYLAFYAFRFVRGFTISGLEQGVGIFYIFLYLCALEILPLLVLIKFLLNSF